MAAVFSVKELSRRSHLAILAKPSSHQLAVSADLLWTVSPATGLLGLNVLPPVTEESNRGHEPSSSIPNMVASAVTVD